MISIKKTVSAAAALTMLAAAFTAVPVSAEYKGLDDGTYLVPIESVSSGAPLVPVKNAVNECFGDYVTMTVSGDKATMVVNPEHMVIDFSDFGWGKFDANVYTVNTGSNNEKILSTREDVVTNPNDDLNDSSNNTQENVTVVNSFVTDVNLDDNNEQKFNVSIDFMAIFSEQAYDEYSTDLTLKLDMDDAKKVASFGSEGTVLNPGRYTIPASLMNASNIANASMAASCIKGAELTVNENGTAYVTVDIGSVTVGTITGFAADWKVYDGVKGALGNASDAEVLETDADGHVTKIRFTVPNNTYDGVFVNMYIDVMYSSPDAYLKLDYADAQPVQKTSTASADFDVKAGDIDVDNAEVSFTFNDGTKDFNASTDFSSLTKLAEALKNTENGSNVSFGINVTDIPEGTSLVGASIN